MGPQPQLEGLQRIGRQRRKYPCAGFKTACANDAFCGSDSRPTAASWWRRGAHDGTRVWGLPITLWATAGCRMHTPIREGCVSKPFVAASRLRYNLQRLGGCAPPQGQQRAPGLERQSLPGPLVRPLRPGV